MAVNKINKHENGTTIIKTYFFAILKTVYYVCIHSFIVDIIHPLYLIKNDNLNLNYI